MAITININGTVTYDESAGAQIGGVAVGQEDNNDSDVAIATLPASFSSRLFGALDLNLSNVLATSISIAKSADDYITLTGTGGITSLGFTTNTGAALPTYAGIATGGAASNMVALDGGAISLFADATLGSRLVLGVDTQNNIVFALFMDPNAGLTSAAVWMVQFEALANPLGGANHDDPLAMTGLGVGAGITTEFDFDELPSGANLFGMLGSGTSGLIVFGATPVLKGDGTYKNPGSDVIQTSQAGVGATIGINSQMFDPNESAYFTYVKNPNSNFTGTNLSPNEADDADNLLYGDANAGTNDTLEANSAFLFVAQIQSGTVASMKIEAYNITDSKGRDLLTASGQNQVEVTRVKVYDSGGNLLADSNVGAANGITFNLSGLGATVTGFEANYKIEWFTTAPHDQVKISGLAGKFDIGGFGINEAGSVFSPLSGVRFEDDGPSITGTIVGALSPTVDESNLAANDSDSFAAQFTPAFGTDGAGAVPVTYALSTPGGASGLLDTATGESIVLSLVGGVIQGRTATTDLLCFTVSVDASGNVTLDQVRAVVHPTADPDESKTLASAGLVVLNATAHDKDGDSASTPLPIGTQLIFKDDGPTVNLELNGAAVVTVDESDIDPDVPGSSVSSSISFASLFSADTEDFGNDGEGTDSSVYQLVLNSAVSGLTDTQSGDPVVLSILGNVITGSVNAGADVVFTIELDPVTEEITLTQYRAMVHDDDEDPVEEGASALTLPEGTIDIQRTVTDGDDDSASDAVDISEIFKFEDDGPDVGPGAEDGIDLLTDDTDVQATASRTTVELFPQAPDYGNDGPNALTPLVYSLELASENGLTDLVDTETGKAIRLVTVGDDIVGYVDEDDSGVIEVDETLEAIRYTIVAIAGEDVEKQVDFIQSRAVYHDDAVLPETVGDGLISISQVAIDGDDDVSDEESVDLGAITFISDDEPEIGPIANSIVDFEKDDFASEDLNGVVGKDPNSSPYTITSYTAALTVSGVDLEGVLAGDAKSVTYYEDTDGSGTFGDGTDVAYYKLELGDQGGEGDYTFTVLVDPPPAFTEFNFDDLPSGSNLFGIVGEGNSGLIVFGAQIGLKADNTYISNQTQEIKTSQAGPNVTIGIESQMFDPGDAAYFTFVSNPNPNFTGTQLGSTEADDADNILYGSTLEGDSAFVRIAQLQGNTAPSMSIEVFNIDDSPQGVNMINARGENDPDEDAPSITAVRVYASDGVTLLESYSAGAEAGMSGSITISVTNGVATVAGFSSNYLIAWDADEDFDQTLITGVGGKFDIGGFGFFQGNDTPDQVLEFEATVTDGDGDTDTATWKVGIDGTGINDDGIVSLI